MVISSYLVSVSVIEIAHQLYRLSKSLSVLCPSVLEKCCSSTCLDFCTFNLGFLVSMPVFQNHSFALSATRIERIRIHSRKSLNSYHTPAVTSHSQSPVPSACAISKTLRVASSGQRSRHTAKAEFPLLPVPDLPIIRCFVVSLEQWDTLTVCLSSLRVLQEKFLEVL